jgi:hypothetical protein
VAYSTQHMAVELLNNTWNQSHKGRDVGAQEHWVPMLAKGGIFASTIVTHSIPRSHFLVLPNPETHPTSKFSKGVHRTHGWIQRYMRLIWLAFWMGHLFVALNWWHNRSNWLVINTWWFFCHPNDIWVSCLCKKLTTSTILYNHECYPQSYDTLDFVGRVGKFGGGIWLWGVDQLVLWIFYNEKLIRQYIMLRVTTLETWHNQHWH